jgi:hypothetical protein
MKLLNNSLIFLFACNVIVGTLLETNEQQKLYLVCLVVCNCIAILLTKPCNTISDKDICDAVTSVERKALRTKMQIWNNELKNN